LLISSPSSAVVVKEARWLLRPELSCLRFYFWHCFLLGLFLHRGSQGSEAADVRQKRAGDELSRQTTARLLSAARDAIFLARLAVSDQAGTGTQQLPFF
jgi:hypothetical protein